MHPLVLECIGRVGWSAKRGEYFPISFDSTFLLATVGGPRRAFCTRLQRYPLARTTAATNSVDQMRANGTMLLGHLEIRARIAVWRLGAGAAKGERPL